MSYWLTKTSEKNLSNKENSTSDSTSSDQVKNSDRTEEKHQKRSTNESLKFFCFGSNSTSNDLKSEEILDREFQSLDIDSDGFVSVADLQSVLKNFSHLCNSNEIMFRIFAELDLNHDRRISKQEFKMYKNALINGQKHFRRSSFDDKISSIFALFDHNRDNFISTQEIRETMKNLGEQIDDQLIEEMMQTADIDHDGRISRDEFKKLLLQINPTK